MPWQERTSTAHFRGRLLPVLLAWVVTASLLVTADVAGAWTAGYGHTGSADRTLRHGCHNYRYHYVVKPGSSDWILETFLFDPDGHHRGAGDFAAGSDPKKGHSHWGICRSVVRPGRFTIKAHLTWYTPSSLPGGDDVAHSFWLKPSHFRLSRP